MPRHVAWFQKCPHCGSEERVSEVQEFDPEKYYSRPKAQLGDTFECLACKEEFPLLREAFRRDEFD